ncbi:hypothetical protein GCM10010532_046270 [Dactylosporangium siamense]
MRVTVIAGVSGSRSSSGLSAYQMRSFKFMNRPVEVSTIPAGADAVASAPAVAWFSPAVS